MSFLADALPKLRPPAEFTDRTGVQEAMENNRAVETGSAKGILTLVGSVLSYLAGGTFSEETGCFAGGPVGAMLGMFLKKPANKDIVKEVRQAVDRDDTLYENIAEAYRGCTNDRDRRMLVQLVCKTHTHEYLKENGFDDLGKQLMATTRKEVEEDGLGSRRHPTQPPTSGKRKSDDTQQQIVDLLWEFSEPASSCQAHCHQFAVGDQPIRFLTETPTHIGNVAEERALCCRNTLLSYWREEAPYIIQPTQYTDYCRYCDDLRIKLRKETQMLSGLKKRLKLAELACDDLREFYKTYKHLLTDDEGIELTKHFTEVDELQHHRECSLRQKAAFEASVSCPFTLTILYDYKEKIQVGIGPVNRDDAHFNKTSVNLLGFVVFVGELQVVVDMVSDSSAQTGVVTCLCIEKLMDRLATDPMTRDLMKDMTRLDFWSDAGSHFRNCTCAWFTLYNMSRFYNTYTRLNFFCEKHGKGRCDAHFHVVNEYIKAYTKTNWVMDASDVKTAVEQRHASVNRDRKTKKERPLHLWVIEYTAEEFQPRVGALMEWRMHGIDDVYCLSRMPDLGAPVKNYGFSDREDGVVVDVTPTTTSTATLSNEKHRKVRVLLCTVERCGLTSVN